jgi:hypothetical protein
VVVYRDQGEQEDVERHFIEASELLIPYRFTYWIGARAAASGANAWPNFRCAAHVCRGATMNACHDVAQLMALSECHLAQS